MICESVASVAFGAVLVSATVSVSLPKLCTFSAQVLYKRLKLDKRCHFLNPFGCYRGQPSISGPVSPPVLAATHCDPQSTRWPEPRACTDSPGKRGVIFLAIAVRVRHFIELRFGVVDAVNEGGHLGLSWAISTRPSFWVCRLRESIRYLNPA